MDRREISIEQFIGYLSSGVWFGVRGTLLRNNGIKPFSKVQVLSGHGNGLALTVFRKESHIEHEGRNLPTQASFSLAQATVEMRENESDGRHFIVSAPKTVVHHASGGIPVETTQVCTILAIYSKRASRRMGKPSKGIKYASFDADTITY